MISIHEKRFFSDTISCMKLTFDDRLLLVASNDGTLMIWVILNTEGNFCVCVLPI